MDIRKSLIRKIEECADLHPGNRSEGGGRYFDRPLIGFASGADPLFREYKRIIGPFHWTPSEIMERAGAPSGGTGSTVVCWILPIVDSTRMSNRIQTRYPSRAWGHTRGFGERFNDELRRVVAEWLVSRGGRAVAPMLMEGWSRLDDPRTGLASTWSERHAAYAAGLGTFSLNGGLITPRGIAHRCGSVVTDILMEPTRRPYSDYRENCLTCRGGDCGVCITRCPAAVISEEGHDKDRCRRYTYGPPFQALREEFGVPEVGCGLCQTGVPCESTIPEG